MSGVVLSLLYLRETLLANFGSIGRSAFRCDSVSVDHQVVVFILFCSSHKLLRKRRKKSLLVY